MKRPSQSSAVMLILAAALGCTRQQPPPRPASAPSSYHSPATTAPATAPASRPAPHLLPEAQHWSRTDALTHLTDETTRLSAAVRLVRLAGAEPPIVPDPLPPKMIARLRVVRLSDTFWALGLATRNVRRLAAPLLIDKNGAVRRPLDPAEEKGSVLCISPDAELFPHLLLAPRRVLLVRDEVSVMLVGHALPGCGFDVRNKDGYWYLALVFRRADRASSQPASQPAQVEVARYEWDPYEESFTGPARDKLPDPPGGDFELDVDASAGLVPVGGDLPEPPPIPPKQQGVPTPF